MTLAEYLADTKTSRAQFARLIGVKHITVTRYVEGRCPDWRIMAKIVEATDGKVTANDFLEAAA